MSHFVILALIEQPQDFINENNGISRSTIELHLEEVLDRYDENREVEEHEVDCWCINGIALKAASAAAHDNFSINEDEKGLDRFRREYNEQYGDLPEDEQPDWKEYIKPFLDFEQSILDAHPMKDKPNPECEDCNGSGTRMTTYNPDSKWDWWVIGGRWTGQLDADYDPRKDPANLVKCVICKGTGDREGWVSYNESGERVFSDEQAEHCNGCNGCMGTGSSVNWTLKDYDKDIRLLSEVEITDDVIPFGIITPDGEWHQRAEMGWFAMTSNENNDWDKEARELLEKYKHCIAVVIDCHI